MNDAVAQSEPTSIPIPVKLSVDPADLRREFFEPTQRVGRLFNLILTDLFPNAGQGGALGSGRPSLDRPD